MTSLRDRLPPLALDQLDAAQRAAADELIAGPRKGVKGPFIPLLRSPELLSRVQKLGEYLRFDSALPPRLSEFATLIVARAWTQQFEWKVHVALALKAGTSAASIAALADGRRPTDMSDDEACVHDFATELLQRHGVSEPAYAAALARFGERGLMDLTALIGYFAMVSMVLNVAHTPAEAGEGAAPLAAFPP
ncbi:MAG TPA: carboxymuconolactone decarboxylase family protein [Albitalea sp.]|uniref:carboxymuconolactone decarboxylase family protein n=1 Tax=Piscinibacter sp. TaxID=1903157 RepID=UPI002ED630A7